MEIIVNNIKVPTDETIRIRFYNPLFNDTGTYSFPVTFNGKLDLVKEAFGYPAREDLELPANIDGSIKTKYMELKGTWTITEASVDRIEAYFKAGDGDFYSQLKDKLLTAVDYGGVKYPAGAFPTGTQVFAHMNTKMSAYYPHDEYAAFCAYTPNADGETTTDARKIVNEINESCELLPTFKVKVAGNDTVYLLVGAVLNYIYAEQGYRITKNIFEENYDLARLVIFNAYNRKANGAFDYSKLLPAGVKVTDFIRSLSQKFNIAFIPSSRTREVKIVSFDMITGGAITSCENKSYNAVVDRGRINGFRMGMAFGDDFARNDYAGIEVFDAMTYTTIDMARDIPASVLTLDDVYYVTSESAFYMVVAEGTGYVAQRLCPDLFPYTEGSGFKQVDQTAAVVANGTWQRVYPEVEDPDPHEPPISTETTVDYILPRYDGEVAALNKIGITFPLMFTFARGIQPAFIEATVSPAVDDEYYPLGSYDVVNALSDKISTANLSLKWHGTYGLVEKLWKNRFYWEMYLKKRVTRDITPEDIDCLIDFSGAKSIGNNNYLVNQIEIELSSKSERISELELYRL